MLLARERWRQFSSPRPDTLPVFLLYSLNHTACLFSPSVKAIEKVFDEGVKTHLHMIFKDDIMLLLRIQEQSKESSFGCNRWKYNLSERRIDQPMKSKGGWLIKSQKYGEQKRLEQGMERHQSSICHCVTCILSHQKLLLFLLFLVFSFLTKGGEALLPVVLSFMSYSSYCGKQLNHTIYGSILGKRLIGWG